MKKWQSEEKNNKLKKQVQVKVISKMKLKYLEFHSINFPDLLNSFTLQFSSQLLVEQSFGECKNSKLKTIRKQQKEKNHQRKIDHQSNHIFTLYSSNFLNLFLLKFNESMNE